MGTHGRKMASWYEYFNPLNNQFLLYGANPVTGGSPLGTAKSPVKTTPTNTKAGSAPQPFSWSSGWWLAAIVIGGIAISGTRFGWVFAGIASVALLFQLSEWAGKNWAIGNPYK